MKNLALIVEKSIMNDSIVTKADKLTLVKIKERDAIVITSSMFLVFGILNSKRS